MMKFSRAAGFTLIELLVVISIIALLIGILLPALSAARRSAQALACSSTVRQIGIGHAAFAIDARGRYPVAGATIQWGQVDTSPGGTNLPSWMEQVDDYIRAKQGGGNDAEPFYSGCPTYPEDSPYHYFLGANAAYIAAGNKYAPVIQDQIRRTSAFVAGGDLNRSFNVLDADKDDFTQPCLEFDPDNPAHPGNYWEPHHDGAMNILFADGHVGRHSSYDDSVMTFAYDDMSPWQAP